MNERGGNRIMIGAAVALLLTIVLIVLLVGLGQMNRSGANYNNASTSAKRIQVVAAENFWGSLASQLCGMHCNVTSIVTDPNADPHEYEASSADARLISNAKLVIVNGVGYDDWALKLVSAGNNTNRIVLNAGGFLGIPNGSNPHLWYATGYVNATIKQIYTDLVRIDPGNASYYAQQYAAVNASLRQVDGRISDIRQKFSGTKVAATEDIFVYLANATGLDLVSPPAFMEAVAEGNDPPAQSISEFQSQLESGNVSVLVYNEQTVTPLTEQMRQIAVEHNASLVGVTETIQPPDLTYQAWMTSQLISLQNALNANALGK